MLRNILYFSISIIVFFIGVILFGVILNLREPTLDEAMNLKNLDSLVNVNIIIDRSRSRLELYSGSELIKSYKAVFGQNSNAKSQIDDDATPIGDYFICDFDYKAKYWKEIIISYPNKDDAEIALRNGIINSKEYVEIISAIDRKSCPPETTALGGKIRIHGIGEYNTLFKNLPFSYNWTDGSIAINNEGIDELLSVVEIGTLIKIKK